MTARDIAEFCRACAPDVAKVLRFLSLPAASLMLNQAMIRLESPLYLAATNGKSEICKVLLEYRGPYPSLSYGGIIDYVHPLTYKIVLQTVCELEFIEIAEALVKQVQS